MGAYRDNQLFAEDRARRSGIESGRNAAYEAVAMLLGVEVDDVLAGMSDPFNLRLREASLRTIATSTGELLAATLFDVETLESDDSNAVASFFMDKQLPEDLTQNTLNFFFPTNTHYRFAVVEASQVEVHTGVRGGPMIGSIVFNEILPLTGNWVNHQMKVHGIELDRDEFHENVAAAIAEKLITTHEAIDG